MTAYFADPDEHPQPEEPLPLVAFLAEHRQLVYRVAVVGHSIIEVVREVGGWIFDRSAQGFHVTVITEEVANASVLRTLGAYSVSLAEAEAAGDDPRPDVLMASTSLCRDRRSVRSAIGAIIRGKETQVLLFGEDVTSGANPAVHLVHYPLGVATAAFKTQALQSLHVSTECDDFEAYGRAGNAAARMFLAAERSSAFRKGLAM